MGVNVLLSGRLKTDGYGRGKPENGDVTFQATDRLYSRARDRGLWGQVGSILTGRSRRLLPLDEIEATCTVHTCRHAGVRTVPISQIRGSGGRSSDFDCDFNPLQDHNKRRWLSIAAARRQGKALPPVGLVQVGDVYFVCDGHHRVSVARALGQQDIEAKVMVWQVSGPLPWERSATAHNLTAKGWRLGGFTSQARPKMQGQGGAK